jgi:hypothetical protein
VLTTQLQHALQTKGFCREANIPQMSVEDDVINIYSSNTFSPEIAAKIFFTDHSESEVNKKLHELANLQVSSQSENNGIDCKARVKSKLFFAKRFEKIMGSLCMQIKKSIALELKWPT